MNLFILDKDYKLSAQYHSDKHIVKMPLECAQLVSTALGGGVGLYKPTHRNHPLSKWAGQSRANFLEVIGRGFALCDEYAFRYNREHKSREVLKNALERACDVQEGCLNDYCKCMPDEFKGVDVVKSYRDYYRSKRRGMVFNYSKRDFPYWF